jgi:hypothetical protein
VPISTDYASRVLMATGSVLALLTLGLPFALEENSNPVGDMTFGGTEVWSGWSLARSSHIDGHVPVPNTLVVVIVFASLSLVWLAWHALEQPGTQWSTAVVGGTGTALLISSSLIGNAVNGTFGDNHQGSAGWGIAVWRVALLLIVVAALRVLLQAELRIRAEKAAARLPG